MVKGLFQQFQLFQVHTFGHPHQYLLQPPFVKITASRRFLLPLMSVWILDEGILDHSSLQNICSSVRFDGCLACVSLLGLEVTSLVVFPACCEIVCCACLICCVCEMYHPFIFTVHRDLPFTCTMNRIEHYSPHRLLLGAHRVLHCFHLD